MARRGEDGGSDEGFGNRRGVLALNGCAGMDPKEQRVLSGAAVGTGAGALTTVITGGCIPCGAAIGAAVGAGAGYVVHQIEKDK